MKNIAVFCGSGLSDDSQINQTAYHVGETLAKQDKTLVYGGAKIGLMGSVAKGTMDFNGDVIGIIPNFLKIKEVVHDHLTELIVTDNMHDRKVQMYDKSDGFIILPGGFGTMDEFFEITTWGQLGLHTKPIGILNTDGFYDNLIAQAQKNG